MTNRVNIIRQEEKDYHDYCYDNYKLFEQGSWLYKPVKSVLDVMSYFEGVDEMKVLDLGCGVGRNSIPIAQKVKKETSKVVCVDFLDSAMEKLKQYSREFNVEEVIEPHQENIANFVIKRAEYDYILAVSSLEHVDSREQLENVLKDMKNGTRLNGVNCIIVNSEVEEIDKETGVSLDAYMEVNISTKEMMNILKSTYSGWEDILIVPKKLEYQIMRRGKPVLFKTTAITYIVRRS
ncbi:class I SAM-dependent methyltransferase [Bacillus spongiae]|uniref:Class I SAM-dependent methyltransferase n=1 Tax=Bacillus spongiae TaxID=2683610 RepID=A0ABU8HFB6_9BACI